MMLLQGHRQAGPNHFPEPSTSVHVHGPDISMLRKAEMPQVWRNNGTQISNFPVPGPRAWPAGVAPNIPNNRNPSIPYRPLTSGGPPPEIRGNAAPDMRWERSPGQHQYHAMLRPDCGDYLSGRCQDTNCPRNHPPIHEINHAPAPPPLPVPQVGLSGTHYVDRFKMVHELPVYPQNGPSNVYPIVRHSDSRDISRQYNQEPTHPANPVSNAPQRSVPRTNEICRDHLRGFCRSGNQCHRMHIAVHNEPVDTTMHNTSSSTTPHPGHSQLQLKSQPPQTPQVLDKLNMSPANGQPSLPRNQVHHPASSDVFSPTTPRPVASDKPGASSISRPPDPQKAVEKPKSSDRMSNQSRAPAPQPAQVDRPVSSARTSVSVTPVPTPVPTSTASTASTALSPKSVQPSCPSSQSKPSKDSKKKSAPASATPDIKITEKSSGDRPASSVRQAPEKNSVNARGAPSKKLPEAQKVEEKRETPSPSGSKKASKRRNSKKKITEQTSPAAMTAGQASSETSSDAKAGKEHIESVRNKKISQPDSQTPNAPPKISASGKSGGKDVVKQPPVVPRPCDPPTDISESPPETPDHSFTNMSGQVSMSSSQSSIAPSQSSVAPSLYPFGKSPPFCIDYLRGSCTWPRCKFPHLSREQIDQMEASALSPSTKSETNPPLSRDRIEPSPSVRNGRSYNHTKAEGNATPQENPTDRLTSMLQRSTRERTKISAPSGRSANTQSYLTVLKTISSDVPLVPPGLGLESKLQEDAATLPLAPPPSVTIAVADSTKVTYGPGFQVEKVVTGFESRSIIIENLPHKVSELEVTAVLEPFGEVSSVQLPDPVKGDALRSIVRATFADHEQAGRAAALLNGALLYGRRVSLRLASHKSTSLGHGKIHDTDVLLEFPSPHRTGYAGYTTKKLAAAAIKSANNTELRGAWVTADYHEGLPRIGTVNVRFWGLPPDAKAEDVNKYGENEGVMMERPNYNHLEGSIRGLREYVETFGELVSFNVLPPPYKKQMIRAWAHFSTPKSAARVCEVIHGRRQGRFGNMKVYARHIKALTYTIPLHVYDTISSDIHALRSFTCDNESGTSISINDRLWMGAPGAPVTIKLASEQIQRLTKLKESFERILKGEKVTQNGEIVWDGFFSRSAGIIYLNELEQKHKDLKINRDPRRRTLALFASPQTRAVVCTDILAKIASLRAQKTHSIPLPSTLIGIFMSADLAKLQEEIGEENVMIDLEKRILRIRGNEDAHQVARLAVLRARERRHKPTGRQGSCPVCFDKVTAPVTLQCGHSWCKSCLSDYLIASIDSKVFPLTCLGKEATCTEKISLNVAQELLSTNQFEAVLKSAFQAHVQSHASEFHYCPTPDCHQLYRQAPPGTILQCPSCLVRICATCHFEDHEGGRCPEMDTEDQQKFKEWKNRHDVKSCPGCQVPIEREAGCNHMTCVRCKTHICWECLATFAKGDEVYKHMHTIHGGIGL